MAPEVDCFLQEPSSSARERSGSDSSPESPAEEYERWVTWWEQALDMPEWWQELVEIPEVDDYQELAQMIWAPFKLLWGVSKLHDVENYSLAPPAHPYLCWKDVLPLPNPLVSCWDIREEQLEKAVAYVQALQFWVEKSNLPTQGQQCLLVGSVLELRAVMGPYVSFPDDAILDGVVLPEGFWEDQQENHFQEHSASPSQALSFTGVILNNRESSRIYFSASTSICYLLLIAALEEGNLFCDKYMYMSLK